MREREVGTLWIGGNLSWMEQLCLQSFVDAGQRITLFHYHPVGNVPQGVILRDGREVIDTEEFLKHRRKNSYALFADRFRLHMIRANPGMIWIDTDVYCQHPMEYDSDYVMGFEKPGGRRVNNAILGLPADSALLADLIAFTDELYPQPAFVKPSLRAEYRDAAKAGTPVHVADMPWGTWGPNMLSWFVGKHKLREQVQPLEAFYPVIFPQRTKFLRRAEVVDSALTPDTTALHFWASNKAEIGARFGGYPPPGSWFAHAVDRHGIRPENAPLLGRGHSAFAAALADERGDHAPPVTRFVDIGGSARGLALTFVARHGATIDLIDLGGTGKAEWISDYRRFLQRFGVGDGLVRVITRPEDLSAAECAAWLGSDHSPQDLATVIRHWLPTLLKPGGQLFIDLHRGDGGFRWLRELGPTQILGDAPATTGAAFRARFDAGVKNM